jgi:hypothetical protein
VALQGGSCGVPVSHRRRGRPGDSGMGGRINRITPSEGVIQSSNDNLVSDADRCLDPATGHRPLHTSPVLQIATPACFSRSATPFPLQVVARRRVFRYMLKGVEVDFTPEQEARLAHRHRSMERLLRLLPRRVGNTCRFGDRSLSP